jgi:hypothetical protein
MMRRAQAVLGPIADFVRTGAGEIQVTNIDAGLLVRQLVLFDRVILRSVRFRELPVLVRTFGANGLRALIDAGLLHFFCDQLCVVTDLAMNGVRSLPRSHFNVGIARMAGDPNILRSEFHALQTVSGLKNSQRAAIEEAVWNSQIRYPAEFGDVLLKQVDSELRSGSSALKTGMLEKLRQLNLKEDLSSYNFDLQIQEMEQRVFRIQAPFARDFGLAPEKADDIIHNGVTSAANLSQRLLEMSEFSALTGYREDEAGLLFGKLASLISQNPKTVEEQFKRVIEIADIPDFKPNQRVDVEKLLAARESDECRAFRDWLREASDLSDEDLRTMTHGIKQRISALGSSTPGKILRLAATTSIGLIPVAGLVLGPVASAVDTFLVDHSLKKSAVVGFLSDIYPSLFKSA